MTRETKIGLLVGLAFIVVFAMLLSHSGPTPPPGDLRQIAKIKQAPDAAVMSEPLVEPSPAASGMNSGSEPPSGSMTEGSPTPPHVDPPAPAASDPPDALPNPDILNNNTPPGAEQPQTGITDSTPKSSALESSRIAPPRINVTEPQRTVREATPSRSMPPEALTDASTHRDEPKAEPKEDGTADSAAAESHEPTKAVASAQPPANAKEYVVQKGDSLFKILKAQYPDAVVGSNSKLKDLFLKANPSIKDDVVVLGKKLVVPSLPSDLLEPASPGKKLVDVAHKKSDPGLAKTDAPIVDQPKHKAPEAMKVAEKDGKDRAREKHKETDSDGEKVAEIKHGKEREKEKDIRTYEVQGKDTFSLIAKKELGSETLWKEIKRLNPDVDPSKMRPGMKLKLPTKRPLADTVAAGSSRRS